MPATILRLACKLRDTFSQSSLLLIGLCFLSAVAQARGTTGTPTPFINSSYCRQAGCVSQGSVKLAHDREVRIYTLTRTRDVELRVYFLGSEAIGAAYVFPLADSWTHRAKHVASFFSAALHTQLTSARIEGFANSPLSSALHLSDRGRRFTLSNDVTSPPGDLTQRVLHVKYGRDLISEASSN